MCVLELGKLEDKSYVKRLILDAINRIIPGLPEPSDSRMVYWDDSQVITPLKQQQQHETPWDKTFAIFFPNKSIVTESLGSCHVSTTKPTEPDIVVKAAEGDMVGAEETMLHGRSLSSIDGTDGAAIDTGVGSMSNDSNEILQNCGRKQPSLVFVGDYFAGSFFRNCVMSAYDAAQKVADSLRM